MDDRVQLQQEQRNRTIACGAFHPVVPTPRRYENMGDCTVWETTTVAHTRKRSAAADQCVTLCVSPFPGRQPTIRFRPFDRPWDGDPNAADKHVYVEPSPLPENEGGAGGSAGFGECGSEARQGITEIPRCGQYDTLRFTMPAPAVRFSAVMCALERAGFVEDPSLVSKAWLLKWCKRPVRSDFTKLLPFQRINHFPGTWRIGKKDELHRHLVAARDRWSSTLSVDKLGEKQHGCCVPNNCSVEFGSFFPEAWVLPDEQHELQRVMSSPEESGNVFIAKLTTSACGRGIQLHVAGRSTGLLFGKPPYDTPEKEDNARDMCDGEVSSAVQGKVRADPPPRTNRTIVQRYISNPLLIEGYKFDLRLYVVVTSYAPLRAYLYKEGLVRFATTPYPTEPGGIAADALGGDGALTAHLTNFTLNKKSEDFFPPCSGDGDDATANINNAASKWTLSALEKYFEQRGLDWDGTMKQIHDILMKVLLCVEPHIIEEVESLTGPDGSLHNSCFEVYGFDVLLCEPPETAPPRAASTPILMEVNIMPSLSTHYSLLDQCIKGNFVADMLTLVGLSPQDSSSHPQGKRRVSTNVTGFTWGHAFLDSLSNRTEREACLCAEEELLRCSNFFRLCPTPESYTRYRALFSTSESAGRGRGRLNEVLSAWERARRDSPPPWAR
uniref:Tubulin--tyrosine ligase-like protein 5 n=1 Tax=Trypanosoma congolense (strain IL3000) TaxID=1068625 RepID=G0UIX4_TRYCI|nr:putative tubulin-tyrosine ligase [Trypanosoma congolense IL3000]